MSRREFAKTLAGSAALLGAVPLFGAGEDPRLTAGKRWFADAQYGMMVHWGLYSLLGGEWKGRQMKKPYHIAEWVQQYFRIPNAEYARLKSAIG